jgi:hypothetical protein
MLAVFLINSVFVALAVLIHYEFLYQITIAIPRLKIRHRLRIVLGIFGAMTAHAVEIWIFAIGYFLLQRIENWGQLLGHYDGSLMACSYFSFVTFTTLGFGDIHPSGNLRYLAGIEALTGMVLVTWTASFLYFEMQRYWDRR